MRGGYFYAATVGFVSGVLFCSFFNLPLVVALSAGTLALAVLLVFIFTRKKLPALISVALGIVFFTLGVIRFASSADVPPISAIESSFGSSSEIVGVIRDEVEVRAGNARFVVSPEEVNGEAIETKTGMLISVDRYERVAYGDRVRLSGKVTTPKNFRTDSGTEFDYVSYLAKDGIGYLMKNPDVSVLSSGYGSWVIHHLYAIKHAFAAAVSRAVPSPEDMLAGGILLGTRSSFPASLTDDFVKTGTIHIVALSGYNVTIVAETIMRAFSFLPIAFASSAGIAAIVLFAILAGGGSTVLRASIMAVLVVLARYVGRTYDVGRALVFAASLMVAITPKILVYDISFQLSFLAALGIVYLSPIVAARFAWVTHRFGLREILSGTLAAQIATFPLIIYKTGIFSVVSLPANILVLPFIPAAMLAGFLTGAAGMLSGVLALPFSFVLYGILHYMLAVIRWFAALPFAAVTVRHVPALLVILVYGLLVWWAASNRKKSQAAPELRL